MKYKLIIFDLDNTLIDYSRTEFEALKKVYKIYFKDVIDLDTFLREFDHINNRLWKSYRNNEIDLNDLRDERFCKIIDNLKADISSSPVTKKYEFYLGSILYPLADSMITLEYLKDKYILSLLTNGIASIQKKKVEKLKLKKMFNYIIISEEIGLKKPSAEFFRYALDLAGVSSKEALMVGDSLESDFIGSKNAQIDFCWFNPKNKIVPTKYPRPQLILKSIGELKNYL
jgi:putative hydrolase of the HAD superfamily